LLLFTFYVSVYYKSTQNPPLGGASVCRSHLRVLHIHRIVLTNFREPKSTEFVRAGVNGGQTDRQYDDPIMQITLMKRGV